MLLQSHLGTPDHRIVELLPALPSEWKNGAVKGIKARGNLTFDVVWKDGKITEATVHCPKDTVLRLKVGEQLPTLPIPYEVTDGILSCALCGGKALTLTF